MKYLSIILASLFILIHSVSADTNVSLGVDIGEKSVGEPFAAQVLIEYSDGEQLGDIFLEGLHNFTLVGESREDSQAFGPNGAVNIINITLSLLPNNTGDFELGPVTLYTDDASHTSAQKVISIKGTTPIQTTRYTPIQSIYFQNKQIQISTLRNLTVFFTILGLVVFTLLFWGYRKNLEIRKLGYIQVLYSLDEQADSKKAPKKFYTDIYNLFKSYLAHEKKATFTSQNLKDMKNKLSKKEYDILDLVYNVDYNRSKDTPKYRKKILGALHDYFNKNIV